MDFLFSGTSGTTKVVPLVVQWFCTSGFLLGTFGPWVNNFITPVLFICRNSESNKAKISIKK